MTMIFIHFFTFVQHFSSETQLTHRHLHGETDGKNVKLCFTLPHASPALQSTVPFPVLVPAQSAKRM